MKYPPVHYHDYLELEKLLGAQKRRSEELGQPAHDEWLFITIHQVYELWFKQILAELDSIMLPMAKNPVPEEDLGMVVRRMERILSILKLSIGNIDVLESMTPLDFLDFRDMLYPASGFQSAQFRLMEVKLGLRVEDRLKFNSAPFQAALSAKHRPDVEVAMSSPSLFDFTEKWLERTPFLQVGNFDFWAQYRKAVLEMLTGDRKTIQANLGLSPEIRDRNLAMIEATEKTFEAIFDAKSFEELRKSGQFRLSSQALQAALFIQVYRDEPILQQPFRFVSCLLDLDEVLATWRYRHAQMAMRMLGRKIGTGGSSGHDYLRETADKHRIFGDFSRLATFLIPRSKIPALPANLRTRMTYNP